MPKKIKKKTKSKNKKKFKLISLKTENHKNLDGHLISPSSFELLDLNDCFYVVSKNGLVLLVDLNKNFKASMKASKLKSKYSDKKQKSMDTFEVKNFTPSIPRPSFNFRWPLSLKKQ